MKNNSLKLLEEDWKSLLADENYLDLGKCLRAIVKIKKSLGELSHTGYDLENKIKILETNLNSVDPRARFTIVGDIIYCRRAINSCTTEEFGSAFHKGASSRIHKA